MPLGCVVEQYKYNLQGRGGKGSRQVPSDCWDGRLMAQGVSGAVGKGTGQAVALDIVSRRFDRELHTVNGSHA